MHLLFSLVTMPLNFKQSKMRHFGEKSLFESCAISLSFDYKKRTAFSFLHNRTLQQFLCFLGCLALDQSDAPRQRLVNQSLVTWQPQLSFHDRSSGGPSGRFENKSLFRSLRKNYTAKFGVHEALSMDSTSIITQVSKEDELVEVNSYSQPCDKLPSSLNKKPRNRNIFSSFLCCFGAQSAAAAVAHTNHNANTIREEPEVKQQVKHLLPPVRHQDMHKKCIVIDLDETLVHSSFKPVSNADFIVPVEIDGTVHQVYVLKRPHVDEFLRRVGELFECVLFTASLSKYADPVANLLDKYDTFRARLFRESCVFHRGNYVKDLSKLGRDLKSVLIVDNSPASYSFHPENAIPVASWFDDYSDTELLDLIPFLESISDVDDVCAYLRTANMNCYKTSHEPFQ